MLSAFDLWILILETRTLWVLIAENVRLTEVNFVCTWGSLWFSDSAVCGESAVIQLEWHSPIITSSPLLHTTARGGVPVCTSLAARWGWLIYQLACFLNYAYMFHNKAQVLFVLHHWEVGSLVSLLVSPLFHMWLKTLDLWFIYSNWIYIISHFRKQVKQKDKLQMLSES